MRGRRGRRRKRLYGDRKKLCREEEPYRDMEEAMETKEKEPRGDRRKPCGGLTETEATWRQKQTRVVPLPAKDSKSLWQHQKLEEECVCGGALFRALFLLEVVRVP